MAYSTEVARLLHDQLARFVTLNRHQLAGQVANLDFWIDEVLHALAVIDGYQQRFERLSTAQTHYVSHHQTIEFTRDNDTTIPPTAPERPRRFSSAELRDARRELCDVCYRVLTRCHNDALLSEAALRDYCDRLSISVDPRDLRPPPPGGQ